MHNQKQASDVRGNQIKCINYSMCPICYGCRSYDMRDPECRECKTLDSNRGKNYNVCNKDLHESWKINKLITKNKVEFTDKVEFKSFK